MRINVDSSGSELRVFVMNDGGECVQHMFVSLAEVRRGGSYSLIVPEDRPASEPVPPTFDEWFATCFHVPFEKIVGPMAIAEGLAFTLRMMSDYVTSVHRAGRTPATPKEKA